MNGHPLQRWLSLVAAWCVLLAGLVQPASAPLALAAPGDPPASVTLAGDLQSEATGGACGDWSPPCAAAHLTSQGNNVWRAEFPIPTGNWQYKMALNDSWDASYAGNHTKDGNTTLDLSADKTVRFYYDHKTNAVLDNVMDRIPVAVGSFQSEAGCAADWNPACVQTLLTDADGDGTYNFETTALQAGDYEGKVALNESWDENYGAGGAANGANIAFSVASNNEKVTFRFVSATNTISILVGAAGDDAALVRPVLQHPIQDSAFYFVLPDRFSNGSTANDTGGVAGGPVDNGYLISDKGYFHGGDLRGLMSKLDYLDSLGVDAIWMTPVFKNRAVQGDGTISGSSAAYHGYWITDYTQIDPHLGSNTEMSELIATAHQRGMKVFFDIITNHTADVIAYEGGSSAYRNKTNFPYKDASGNTFDDADYAGTDTFPALDANTSFPYKPVFANAADASVKKPDWLNNPIYYHNRGNSSFSGENSTYGDFFGLDDLFTEQPAVVDGMIDIYKTWVKDFGIDGFRIDTVKHVNLEFWQKFGPEVVAYAKANGKPDFFMYGEVFDGNPAYVSQFTTAGKLQSALDFGFQGNARSFASGTNPTNSLRDLFANDDYYTDADSNAYSLPTFLGNHDMGRVGFFLKSDVAGASDADLLARSKLAHGLMFFARGMPVVYYGDEQGFVGDGGDKDARQDMFPSQVASYNDDDLIGTDKTTADDNFDTTHPLYQTVAAYDALRDGNLALRRGLQIHRYSSDQAGIYAFSRIESGEKVEYIVALNNANEAKTASFKTYQPGGATLTALYPAGGAALTADAQGNVTVTVPALGVVVYKANAALAGSSAAPSISISAPAAGAGVQGRTEIAAQLGSDQLAEVTFAVKVGDASEYEIIGTDGNAPYRVFYDVSGLENGTTLSFKAIVSDLNGHTNAASVDAVVSNEVTPPPGECPAPTYAIVHYNRPAGDYDGWGLHLWGDAIDDSEATDWTSPKLPNGQDGYGVFWFIKLKDASKPVNYIIHKGDEKDTPNDRSFNPSETPDIWTFQGSDQNHPSAAVASQTVSFRYYRPAGDYDGWGLHLWGDAIDPSEATEWASPKPFTVGSDGWGTAVVKLIDPSKPVNFIIHKGDEKDTADDRNVIPADLPAGTNYMAQGDGRNHPNAGSATNTAIVHYYRPAGDYGDYSSTNFNDFWGMHVWTGATTPTDWTQPLKPARADRFGQVFEVPLVDGATTLNYILHKGDAKDLPDDQELDLVTVGYEVWVIQATPGYLLPREKCDASCVAQYDYAVLHYNRPAGDYDGWGLHLWGDAIDPSEATEWASPKQPNGEDGYGVFWYIKLQDASQPVNFIIHKGDEKDTPDDRSWVPGEGPENWVKQGDGANYPSAAAASLTVSFRYYRPAGDYDGWGLHLWGDAIDPSEATEWASPKPFTVGSDGWGTAVVKLIDPSKPVNFIIHKGDEKDTADDRNVIPADLPAGTNYMAQGDGRNHPNAGSATNTAIVHYYRPAGDYGDYSSTNFNDFWGMHVWTGATTPTDWTQPLKPARADRFGQVFEVPLVDGATTLNYILHKGDAKDLPDDQELDLVTVGYEVWVIQATPGYLLPFPASECSSGPKNSGDLNKQKAHWLDRNTIAVNIEGGVANTYTLYYDPTGAIKLDETRKIGGGQSIALTFDPAGLSAAQKEQWPHLAAFSALKVAEADQGKLAEILKGQIAVAAVDRAGNQVEATGVQIPGVLDDLFSYNGPLGVSFAVPAGPSSGRGNGTTHDNAVPTLRLWAPTAKSVKLHIFGDSNPATTSTIYPMNGDAATGVWSISGDTSWKNKFYLYEVEVFVPSTGKVENNIVSDPYALSLSLNSKRSQIVNMNDAALRPSGWTTYQKPPLAAPEDIVLYELHVRDFSIRDSSVPEASRGTFDAFTYSKSNGMQHLKRLADAGMTTVHLLPAFDCASIEEDKALRQEADPAELATYPPDSEKQADAVEAVRDKDGFNWCYDPYHYTAPEGSYARNPDGSARILEFRRMVQSLNLTKLRVVMDVVYNHTAQSGQGEKSVLDKVVPGYYHRLNLEGAVETSTCCQNTASEHTMMEKLLIDSVITWATAYKVDGFRFDLMGHHMKSNMVKLRAELDKLTLAKDGVDGKAINLYGEGWNFGEVGNNARGVNATQLNLPGTGIGTFSDRLRDAVRGGGPFDDGENKKIQGFINGLYYDPNALEQGGTDAQKGRLLLSQDQIKVGLTGNLADYQLTDRNGNLVTGAQIDYNGSPAGYTKDPQEVITYIEAHDNETLFDKIQYAAPASASIKDRVRMQNLGNSIVMLSQGTPFFQAGQDLLRSKSFDRNSYNSGDWFNQLDLTYNSNGWGIGLPPNESRNNWPIMKPLLGNPALKPAKAEIVSATEHFAEMLRIRKSSPLFRLRTAAEVQQRLTFLGDGPNQAAGLIVMCISDTVGTDLDKDLKQICVVFNANDEAQNFSAPSLVGKKLALHPIQKSSKDSVVRTSSFEASTGTFKVPARTTAVFVLR